MDEAVTIPLRCLGLGNLVAKVLGKMGVPKCEVQEAVCVPFALGEGSRLTGILFSQ